MPPSRAPASALLANSLPRSGAAVSNGRPDGTATRAPTHLRAGPPGRPAPPGKRPLDEPADPPRRGLHFRDAVAPFCVKMCVAAYFPKPSSLAQTTGILGLRGDAPHFTPSAMLLHLKCQSAPLKDAPVPSASNRLRNLTAQGPFPPENVVFLNLWLASQSRTLSPAAGSATSGRLPAQQAPQYAQPTARSRAQHKKHPACRASGGGRMRGVQAGGCLL